MEHFQTNYLTIKAIMLLKLIFGYFNNVYSFTNFKILAKSYAVLLYMVIVAVHVYFDVKLFYDNNYHRIYITCIDFTIILENTVYLYMSIFYEEQHFVDCCAKINNYDGNKNLSAFEMTCSNAYILLSIFLFVTGLSMFFACITRDTTVCFHFAYIFDILNGVSLCFRHITTIIIFELFRSRMRNIRIHFEKRMNTEVASDDLINKTITNFINLNKYIQTAKNQPCNSVYVSDFK